MSGSNFKGTIHLQVLVLPLRWQLLKQVFSFLIVCCNNNISLELQNYHIDNAIRGCMRAEPKQTKFLKSPSPYKGRSDCSHRHHLSIWIQPPWAIGYHSVFNYVQQKVPLSLKQFELCFCPVTYNRKNLDSQREIPGVGTWPAVEYFFPSRVELCAIQKSLWICPG